MKIMINKCFKISSAIPNKIFSKKLKL